MLCPRCGYYSDREDSVCPECGEIIDNSAGAPAEGAEAIRQGKRARQAIRNAAAMRQAQAERRKKRSGASHATVEMPAVQDNRQEETFSDYTVSETESLHGEGEEEDGVFERRHRPVYDENAAAQEQALEYSMRMEEKGRTRLKTINWIKIGIALFGAVVLLIAGAWFFLNKTEAGQKIMARFGREATSSALWAVGEQRRY